MSRGLTYLQAAQETRRSVSTVRSLLHRAYGRLGVSTIAQALAVCTSAGWLDPVPLEGTPVELADRRVTWAQRLYLEAFDQSLRVGQDSEEFSRTETLREAALTGVYKEAHRTRPPQRRPVANPIDRIVRDLLRFSAADEMRQSVVRGATSDNKADSTRSVRAAVAIRDAA